jgi:hypothetical protein
VGLGAATRPGHRISDQRSWSNEPSEPLSECMGQRIKDEWSGFGGGGRLRLGDRRCSIRGGEVAGDRASSLRGGSGSPVRAGTGEEGPTSSLAGLRPQEQDRRWENNEGEVLWAGRATPVRNPDHRGDSGALRCGLVPAG